jgi:hypothetical protein
MRKQLAALTNKENISTNKTLTKKVETVKP